MGYIGRAMPRFEDPPILRGEARYVGDLMEPDLLEVAFARSWAAHGTIRAVDVTLAREAEGVLGAWSAADLEFPVTPPTPPNLVGPGFVRPTLASDRVRYVGEPVAVVVAESRYSAEDGVDEIDVDIEPLTPVLDPRIGADPSSPRLFGTDSNVVVEDAVGTRVDDLFEEAPVVLEGSFEHPRVAPMPLEGRAILAIPDGAGRLQVSVSHQAPHRLRAGLSEALSLPQEDLSVTVPHVGGAFGGKSQTYPEYIAVCFLALHLGRPLRWVEDRTENLTASSHGRGQYQQVKLAASEDGRVLALDVEIHGDIGAYPHTGSFIPSITASMIPGPYDIANVAVRYRAVLTNSVPTTAYRGAGRPEATLGLEMMLDRLASRVALSPQEVRKRNFIEGAGFPFQTATGQLYEGGDYGGALELAGFHDDPPPIETTSIVGTGAASYVERSGGQSGGFEFGEVHVSAEGRVVVRSGSMSTGQGHQTTMAQIAASALDVDIEAVDVIQGNTDQVERGFGTFASRSMQLGGSAVHVAAARVLAAARRAAAGALEVSEGDLRYDEGRFSVAGAPSRSIGIFELAGRSGFTESETFPSSFAYPYGSYAARVELDLETGRVRVDRIVAIDDCGVVVNPLLAEGQIQGAIVQGIGATLFEAVRYDENGQPLTSSMADYLAPTISETPDMELISLSSAPQQGPLGSVGVGEAGCIGAPPAVANAVLDALARLGVMVEHVSLPLGPEEIWRLMKQR